MATITLEIVTAERLVLSEEVDVVVAPGAEGELAVLPHHAPLLTTLKPGELRFRQQGREGSLVLTGGFLEVRGEKVTVLADAASAPRRLMRSGPTKPSGGPKSAWSTGTRTLIWSRRSRHCNGPRCV